MKRRLMGQHRLTTMGIYGLIRDDECYLCYPLRNDTPPSRLLNPQWGEGKRAACDGAGGTKRERAGRYVSAGR